MTAYFIIFFLASIPIIFDFQYNKSVRQVSWYFLLFILIIFIGFRDKIGGDWYGLVDSFNQQAQEQHRFKFSKLDIGRSDYGYELISWIIFKLGLDIYSLNFIFAVFFIFALNKFLQKQDNPILGLVVCIPYIIISIGMGFVRQSIAFAFLLLALNFLVDNKKYRFILLIFLGSFFHKSLIVMSLLYFCSSKISIKPTIFLTLILLSTFYIFQNHFYDLYINYIGEGRLTAKKAGVPLESPGGIYRTYIASLMVLIFLIFQKTLSNNKTELRILLFFSLVILLSLIFVNYRSTFIDRILIYFTPLQIIVLSRISRIMNTKKFIYLVNNFIIASFCLYLLIWFIFAFNSHSWHPYKLYFFG